jgi:dephospho-CoA kinase
MSYPAAPARSVIVIGGGIGAGKSSVLEIFGRAGFLVIGADAVGHEVLSADQDSGKAVMRRWPSAVVDGSVSRSTLAAIVFADPDELRELEGITHPAIRAEIVRRVEVSNAHVALEVPVLGMFDEPEWYRLAILAPEDVRLARAVARGDNPDDIRARMAIQPSDEEWEEWADTVVDNSSSWEATGHALEPFVVMEVER